MNNNDDDDFSYFFQNKVRLQGTTADSFWHKLTFYIIKIVFP